MSRQDRRKVKQKEYSAELLAKRYHDLAYQLAPQHNCERVTWDETSEDDRELAKAVCTILIDHTHRVLRARHRKHVIPGDQMRILEKMKRG